MTLAQILTLALLAAALYFFYASGYLPVSSRIALLYAGGFPFRTQHDRIEAHFSGCRGWERWRLPLRAGLSYRLQLEMDRSSGEIAVEIRESGTGLLLTLDEHLSAATLTAQKGKCYTATVQMMGASGSYALCWEREADCQDSF